MKAHEKLKILIAISWRNVWKNERRTVLTLLTIAAGSSMIVLLNAFAKGGHNQSTFSQGQDLQEHGSQFEAIKLWIAQHTPIRTPLRGRITL